MSRAKASGAPKGRNATKSTSAKPRKRRHSRFTAEEARDAILTATEKRLLEVGPQGLRLKEIARDVGLSHPTVIHHFGSREGLVEAVASRAVNKVERELLACFTNIDVGADPRQITRDALEQVDEALRRKGHAKLLAWLALSKLSGPGPQESLLGAVAQAVHMAWSSRAKGASAEDASFTVLLTAAAMFGVAIVGPELLTMLGLPDDEEVHSRFRDWFATALVEGAGLGED